jgi:hypothetical protein
VYLDGCGELSSECGSIEGTSEDGDSSSRRCVGAGVAAWSVLVALTWRCYCVAGGSEELGSKVFTEVIGRLERRRSRAPVRYATK